MLGATASEWIMMAALAFVGVGVGAARAAAYSAAGSVIPPGAHGTGFGMLTSASLAGMAVSPMAAGFLGATAIRAVFLVDVVVIALLSLAVSRLMKEGLA